MSEQPKQFSNVEKLLYHKREVETAIHVFERMFGTIINEQISHPHHSTVKYLQGYLRGMEFVERTIDL